MDVFILDRKTLKCKVKGKSSRYSFPAEAAEDVSGIIVVTDIPLNNYSGDWVLCAGHLLFIKETKPTETATTLTVADAIEAFSRPLEYVQPSGTVKYGQYITDALTREYINQSDTDYKMPYIAITDTDTTAYSPAAPEDGLFNLNLVMRQARRMGVRIKFGLEGSHSQTLRITFAPPVTAVRNLFFTDGTTVLSSENYDFRQVSKVTVIGTDSVKTTFYLTKSGDITQTKPTAENRAAGEWSVLKADDDDNAAALAAAEFNANLNSHKISFQSERDLTLYQPLAMRLHDNVFYTSVTYKGVTSGSDWYSYECGELAVTLTERIKRQLGSA